MVGLRNIYAYFTYYDDHHIIAWIFVCNTINEHIYVSIVNIYYTVTISHKSATTSQRSCSAPSLAYIYKPPEAQYIYTTAT